MTRAARPETAERSHEEDGPLAEDITRDPGSYRDPAGYVFRRDGVVYRRIEASFAEDWKHYLASGLYARLRDAGQVLAHEDVDESIAGEPRPYRVIRPEPIALISYPWEWAFSQLKDAALLTLELQASAASVGMTLRDASAFNIQSHQGRPVLIDSLSFERAEPGAPWLAYRQFCEHFLAPLALMAKVDIRLGSLLRDHLEGIPLDLAARLLPTRTRVSMSLGPHIHLHARAQRQHAADASGGARAPRASRMSESRLAALIESLRGAVAGLDWEPAGTVWADYAEHTSYDEAATGAKEAAVAAALRAAEGRRAVDLGANTARYSRIAAGLGYRVIALDVDPGAVERAYRDLRREGRTDILPLLGDLGDPSPALGWGNQERAALLDRLEGDVLLALALVHHLAIGRNVPLPMIAALFARIAPHAVVEFVPKEDAMVQRLLHARRDVFAGYTEEGFRAAFGAHFEEQRVTPIEGTSRTLFHFVRRSS